MKKTMIAVLLTGGCILTGCGVTAPHNDKAPVQETTVPVTTTVSTTAATTTTASATTTAPATTTAVLSEPPASVQMVPLDNVEVYQGLTVSQLFPDTNAELLEKDKVIDTSEVGEKAVKVKFSYEGAVYEKDYAYQIHDTTPPIVLNSGWEPYAKQGQPLDFNKLVGYADNFDRSPVLTYTGEVDTNVCGSYPISVTVTDSSGNAVSWDMTVEVVPEIPKPQDNNPRVAFEDFKANNDYADARFGIDVSAWQTNVDYNAVKEQGVEFVIMRMGYYYSEIKMDDYYKRNIEEATAAGLDIGVYFYTTDNTEEGVREHARWIVEQLGGRQTYFPIAFDWEEFGHFQQYGMNIHDLNDLFEAFCDELEKAGYKGMLYSSKNFLNNFWTNRNNRPVWLAHFVDVTDYTGPYAIWQASAYVRMNGIEGDVDVDIQFVNEPLE